MAHQEEPDLGTGAEPRRRQPGASAILRCLAGGVPITVLACLGVLWLDRDQVPSLLTRLAYPAALVVGALGTVGWTRLAMGRRVPELELTVVVIAIAAAVAVLAALAAFLQ